MLRWTEIGHNFEAVGGRGVYTIHRAPGFYGCVLTATGHDALPMLALDPYGKSFTTPQLAKDFAQRLDGVKTIEPHGGVG